MDVRRINHLLNRSKQFKTYLGIARACIGATNMQGIIVKAPPPLDARDALGTWVCRCICRCTCAKDATWSDGRGAVFRRHASNA